LEEGNLLATLHAEIDRLPDSIRWTLDKWGVEGDIDEILEGIVSGTAALVADGSFDKQVGTASGYLESKPHGATIWFEHMTSGSAEDQSAYRSELGGMLGSAVLLWSISKAWKVTSGSCSLSCDNDESLEKTKGFEFPCSISAPHVDLIRDVRSIIRRIPFRLLFPKVAGHQDRDRAHQELSRLERLNVRADQRAGLRRAAIMQSPPYFAVPSFATWSLWIGEMRIVKDTIEAVYQHATRTFSEAYWERRMSHQDVQEVDWVATLKATKTGPYTR